MEDSHGEQTLACAMNAVTGIIQEIVEEAIRKKLSPGQPLHRVLCLLYDSLVSRSSDLQHFVDCIRDLAYTHSNLQAATDILTDDLRNYTR